MRAQSIHEIRHMIQSANRKHLQSALRHMMPPSHAGLRARLDPYAPTPNTIPPAFTASSVHCQY